MPPTAECEKLMELYERLEELDADKAEMRASRILHGLGFTPAMQRKKLKDFSGGWRMRVALARRVSPLSLFPWSPHFLECNVHPGRIVQQVPWSVCVR